MVNIPADSNTVVLELPKEDVKKTREAFDLPELPEERNPILESLGKSHSDYTWTDEFNMRGAYTILVYEHSTEASVIDWIKSLEATAEKARKLKFAGFDVVNFETVNRTLNEAYKKLHQVQAQEAKREKLAKAKAKAQEARDAARIQALVDAERGNRMLGLTIDNNLVLLSEDPEYPFLVRRGDDFFGFDPSKDAFDSLPESIQLALMPALVFMDELHLTPENTRVFRQWFIDKF